MKSVAGERVLRPHVIGSDLLSDVLSDAERFNVDFSPVVST
jgi:hypothetical protein